VTWEPASGVGDISIPDALSDVGVGDVWQLLDALPQLTWVADSDGLVIHYNGRFRLYSGISQRTDGTWSWAPVVHPDDVDLTATRWASAVARGEPYECEHRVRMADGTFRWHVSRALEFRTGGGRSMWFGTATDVHAQKLIEEALRASEQQFRDTFENAAVGMAHVALDGRFVEVNGTLSRILGYDRPHLCSIRFQDITHRYDVEAAERNAQALFDGSTDFITGDMRWRRNDGELVWVHVTASLSSPEQHDDPHLIAVVEDIEERKRVEALARDSQRFTQRLLDQLFVFVGVLTPDGTLIESNRALLEAAGMTRDEVVGKNFLDAYWWKHARQVQSDLRDGLERGARGEFVRFDVPVRRRGADVMWIDFHLSPLLDESGSVTHLIASAVDITDRVHAARALSTSEARFRAIANDELQARLRAEFVTELITELETVETVQARAQRLVDLLVEGLAATAALAVPSFEPPVIAVAARDPAVARALRSALEHPSDDGETKSSCPEPVTVWLGSRTVGSLYVDLTSADRPFHADATLLHEIAERAGLVLQAAHLRESEHRAAVRLQQALLPHQTLEHPSLAIAVRYVAAADALEVGGDWYETFTLPDGLIGVVVGDVVGHSLDAAVAMGQLRSGFLALAGHRHRPADLLTDLDRFARHNSITDFATACCAVLDPTTGTLRYSSAGHPPMLVVAPGGEPTWLDQAHAPPLGVAWDGPRQEAVTQVEPGSLLLAYSDGLVEQRREPIDVGLQRLQALAVQLRCEPVEAITERIIAELTDDIDRRDDVVVLCLHYHPE
jgi:PAS domain S-box-containing protein